MATGSTGNILIRMIVGWIFLSEGVLKFLEPQTRGVGRFTKIGIPQEHDNGAKAKTMIRSLIATWASVHGPSSSVRYLTTAIPQRSFPLHGLTALVSFCCFPQ